MLYLKSKVSSSSSIFIIFLASFSNLLIQVVQIDAFCTVSPCLDKLKELQSIWLKSYYPISPPPTIWITSSHNSSIAPPTAAEIETKFNETPPVNFTNFFGLTGKVFNELAITTFADWKTPSHFTDIQIVQDLLAILQLRIEYEDLVTRFEEIHGVFMNLLFVYSEYLAVNLNNVHPAMVRIRTLITTATRNTEFDGRPSVPTTVTSGGADLIVEEKHKIRAKGWVDKINEILRSRVVPKIRERGNILPEFTACGEIVYAII